ncbi:MAG: PstS family phosphate ABC transporter substrate-binding protein [Planctomycetota bacterium]
MKIALVALLSCLLTGCFWKSGRSYTEVCNKGSDTMLEVAGAWAEAYDKVTDHIVISVSGGGSGTGIANVISGTIDLANSSRKLKPSEDKRARALGQEPVEHIVGFDGIAVYVHKDNPLQSITMEQLDALFGDGGELENWTQLGVDFGNEQDNEVVLVSRQNNSGTYEYFREAVLGKKGRFKPRCLNLNGSKDVVEFCSGSLNAIGYSGLAYATEHVRLLPVVNKGGGEPVTPSNDTILDRSYPISRPLYMYTNGQPQGAVKEYLDWILGDDGQTVLKNRGYSPVRPL